MSSSLSGSHLIPKLTVNSNVVCVARHHSRCFGNSNLRETRLGISLEKGFNPIAISTFNGNYSCRDCVYHRVINNSSCSRDGLILYDIHVALSSSPHGSFYAACASSSNATTEDSDSDSDSDADSASDQSQSRLASALANQIELLKEAASPSLPVPSKSLEPESWMLMDGEDVPTVVSNLPLTERYKPRRLLQYVTKKLDPQMFSLAQLRSAVMFWQKKEELQKNSSFGSSAFGEVKGVSQLQQWTATELTLQHARLSRIARDILYLVLACTWLGFVRVLEALLATFSSSPPHYSKLLDAANSLDFFTMAFLAHSVRKPIIGILCVDPTNLDDVVRLKSKIWDEMHKFYERQWKAVATLGVGRLLALIAQTSPSTNTMTRNAKMCWDFLLALPIF